MTLHMHAPDTETITPNDPKVTELVAQWYAGAVGRREFLVRATVALGTLAAATTLLEACGGSTATNTAAPAAATATKPAGAATGPTIAAGSTTASTTAASPAATTAPTTAGSVRAGTAVGTTGATTAGSATAGATQAVPGTAAGGSAPAGTRPAGSAVTGTTTTGSAAAAPAAAGTPVATGVAADAVNAKMVQFANGTVQVIAYEARPKTGTGPFPAVIVIHENTGLTDHIKDVTRRLAKEGYIGLGVDFLSRDGGTMAFNTPQDATTAINKVTDEQFVSDVNAAVQYLTGAGVGAPKVGIVGFCWGGRRSLVSAEKAKGLSAAVIYYGPVVTPDGVQTVDTVKEAPSDTCPVLGNFGAADPIIPAAKVMELQQALTSAGKSVDFKVYDGAGHAFNNDTRPFNGTIGYVPAAAQDAWTRTLAFYKKNLG